jgi:hypothetical protein
MHIQLLHGSADNHEEQLAFVADSCHLDVLDVRECLEAFP